MSLLIFEIDEWKIDSAFPEMKITTIGEQLAMQMLGWRIFYAQTYEGDLSVDCNSMKVLMFRNMIVFNVFNLHLLMLMRIINISYSKK